MQILPREIYEATQIQEMDKLTAIDLLISILEHGEDDLIREDCIEIFSKLSIDQDHLFPLVENLFISDPNEKIRCASAKLLGKCFLDKCLEPMLWALGNESSYECLIIIVETLEKLDTNASKNVLRNKIESIQHPLFHSSLKPLIKNNKLNKLSSHELSNILKNFFTLSFLERKFSKLKYTLQDAIIQKLDFSSVDNQVINWKDRKNIKDISVILGIENVPTIKKLKLFSIQWAIQNDYSYLCQITLIKNLLKLNPSLVHELLIYQLSQIRDPLFQSQMDTLTDYMDDPEKLSNLELADLLINYISIMFLSQKYPKIAFSFENGYIIDFKLHGTPLIKIPKALENLHHLRTLILKNCSLYALPQGINNYKNLEILDLEANNLQTLPDTLGCLSNLKQLNIKKNRLINLPESIKDLGNLEVLNLESNQLRLILETIGNLTSLNKLSIHRNHLKSIPDTIGKLKELRYLNIYLNELTHIPNTIGQLNSLTYLNMDSNRLTDIPSSIGNLKSLKKLKLGDNRIASLPETLGDLKCLKICELQWNRLKALPNSIGGLRSLKSLYLMKNRVRKLPESLGKLYNLEILDLTWNQINHLPDSIGDLHSLRSLNLFGNKLTTLPESIGQLNKLLYLNICSNKLITLPKSLGNLYALEDLLVNCNKLTDLPYSLNQLKNLKKIILNKNNFSNISELISKIPSVKEFLISGSFQED